MKPSVLSSRASCKRYTALRLSTSIRRFTTTPPCKRYTSLRLSTPTRRFTTTTPPCNPNNHNPHNMSSSSSSSTTTQQEQQPTSSTSSNIPEQPAEPNQSSQQPPLPLPEPSSSSSSEETTTKININSEAPVKLDHLGPLVVNKDGTLSRITNWATMAEIERQNTLRILGKRNQLRRESLKKEGGEEVGEVGGSK